MICPAAIQNKKMVMKHAYVSHFQCRILPVKAMKEKHIIAREGSPQNGKWTILK